MNEERADPLQEKDSNNCVHELSLMNLSLELNYYVLDILHIYLTHIILYKGEMTTIIM